MFDQALIDYFWSLADKSDGADGCWWWLGPSGNFGYGTIAVRGRAIGAHRFVCILEYGDMEGLEACHTCDNPRCVNPAHLFPGTHKENMSDMVSKGRFPGKGKQPRLSTTYRVIEAEVLRRRSYHPAFRKCGIYSSPRPPRY